MIQVLLITWICKLVKAKGKKYIKYFTKVLCIQSLVMQKSGKNEQHIENVIQFQLKRKHDSICKNSYDSLLHVYL